MNFKERDLSAKGCVCVVGRGAGGVTFYTKRLEKVRSFLIYDLKVNEGESRGQRDEQVPSSRCRRVLGMCERL